MADPRIDPRSFEIYLVLAWYISHNFSDMDQINHYMWPYVGAPNLLFFRVSLLIDHNQPSTSF